MGNQPPEGEPERQWQQPAFEPRDDQNAGLPVPVMPALSAELVPASPALPPSVAETTLATVSGVIWPVVIVLAIAGYLSWWPAILIAIVTSVITDNVRKHLRQRRRALGAAPDPGNGGESLR